MQKDHIRLFVLCFSSLKACKSKAGEIKLEKQGKAFKALTAKDPAISVNMNSLFKFIKDVCPVKKKAEPRKNLNEFQRKAHEQAVELMQRENERISAEQQLLADIIVTLKK